METNITKIDYFAGLAMQAMLNSADKKYDIDVKEEVVAINSVRFAYALLNELERRDLAEKKKEKTEIKIFSEKTIYDEEIEAREEAGLPFQCPPIFREGLSRYQMTCNDCPPHVRQKCKPLK